MSFKPDRQQAWGLLTKYNSNEALLKHALAVEATMRHFAKMFGEDEEKWGAIGLLHDLDYELYPTEHCKKVIEIANEHDLDEQYLHAILSHGYGLCSDVYPELKMEKILYTIDELTGLINAAALMRPSKSVNDLEVSSLKKKFKQSSFAAGVNREVITNGAKMLEMELDYLMKETIIAMRAVSDALCL